MKKRARSAHEQRVTQQRLAAGVRLQGYRPKVEDSVKTYNRTKQKRLWQKDQEALRSFYSSSRAAFWITGSGSSASRPMAARAASERMEPTASTSDSRAERGAFGSASSKIATARSRPTLAMAVAATAAR